MLGGGIAQQQRALSQIIEHEGGQHEREPREPDGLLAEVSHVGVERLSARHDEKHRAEHRKAGEAVALEEPQCVPRVDGGQHLRRPADPHDAERGDRREPDDDDRTKQPADAVRAELLDRKQDDQNRDRDRHHIGTEDRRGHLEPLDGAEDGNRRRDHAVAVEQRRSEDAQRDQQRPSHRQAARRAGLGPAPWNERRQGENPAFALVVRAHDDDDVLERDDEQQRVDDERQHAEHVLGRGADAVRAEETLAHGVQRTRADVAVDDAERR